jgi:aminoglycoside phosphotransferase (APT) family kinase protein
MDPITAAQSAMQRPSRMDRSDGFKEKVASWFRERMAQNISLVGIEAPKSNGFSNDTIFVKVALPDGAGARYVVRRVPISEPIFLGLDMSVQHKVIRAVRTSGQVPVPTVPWAEEDPSVLGAPFFVMEHIDGFVPSDTPPYTQAGSGWVANGTAAERAKLWWSGLQAMAGIHRLDWQAAGLGWMTKNVAGGRQLEWELDYYRSLFENGCAGHYRQLCGEAFNWISNHLPNEQHIALCWGDARPGNMMFRDWSCVAVLDWEMASLGAPEKDLAWWLFLDRFYHEGLGIQRMAGWPSHEETIAQYQQWLGRSLDDLGFYSVFAGFRSLIIYTRFVALGLQPLLPEDVFPGSRMLRRMLDEVHA